jgi:hypothetical protein
VDEGQGFQEVSPAAGATPAAATPAASTPAATPATTDTATPAAGATPAAADAGTPPAAATPTVRPDYIPEAFWDAEKGAPKLEDIGAKLKTVADREAAAALVADWDKFELKTEIKDIAGNAITIDRDNPLVKALGGIAKERGWGPEDVNPLIDTIVTAQKAAVEAEKREFESLGDQRFARRDAVLARGAALLGEGGDAKIKGIVSLISTAEQFKIFEQFVNAAAGPRAAEPRPGGTPLSNLEVLYPDDVKKRA